jgi:DNA-binding response OmpR family regulator
MAKKKILLVDDSHTVLLLHRMMLSHCGYELITARDGQEALDKASTSHPDLIFLDVHMPRMDGFQTCRALRSRDETKNVPIILVTTRSEPQYVRQGFESGCTDYITKPFDGEELLAKVRSHLEEARHT